MICKPIRKLLALGMAICIAGGLFGCGRTIAEQELTRYEIREEVRSLEMDIGGAEIRFLKDDDFAVETDNPYISVDVRNGALIIRERSHVADLESSVVLIRCPIDQFFDSADIDMGAGRLEGVFLNCAALELDLGAGEMLFDSIDVSGEAEISGGAGAMDINILRASKLDLELGVGECVIHSLATERADIDAGVGKLEITISAGREDYTIHTEQGLGGISIDGEPVGSGTFGSGPNRIELSGGVGSIELRFEA